MRTSSALPPRTDQVHAALRWALDHDLGALLEHRQLAHLGASARRTADATIVARWRRAGPA